MVNVKCVIHIQPQQWFDYFRNLFSSNTRNKWKALDDNYVHDDSAGSLNDPFKDSEISKAKLKLKTGIRPVSDGLMAECFNVV